ncbi:MAG: protein kinase [Eubacteriales bacterium]|nr:protein kinase [Eubacteriales bacterium]
MGNEKNYTQELLSSVWPEWRITKLLGRGTYGAVYEIIRDDPEGGDICALKVLQMYAPAGERPKKDRKYGDPGEDTATVRLLPGSERSGKYVSEGPDENPALTELIWNVSAEIERMLRLKGSPGIVSIEDYAVLRDREKCTFLIRMEELEEMEHFFARTGGVSREKTIYLGMDICTALSFCEQNAILHRDIKPDNILYSYKRGFKLGDIGISGAIESLYQKTPATGTGMPVYTAPEICRGEKYDNTADIYSLGLVLYNLMNGGFPPFYEPEDGRGDNGFEDSNFKVETANRRRLNGEPLPPPVYADFRLAKVICKACAPDPADRYSTALEFRQALQDCLSDGRKTGGNTEGNSSGNTGEKTPFVQTDGFIALLLAILVACTLFLVFALWNNSSVRKRASETASGGTTPSAAADQKEPEGQETGGSEGQGQETGISEGQEQETGASEGQGQEKDAQEGTGQEKEDLTVQSGDSPAPTETTTGETISEEAAYEKVIEDLAVRYGGQSENELIGNAIKEMDDIAEAEVTISLYNDLKTWNPSVENALFFWDAIGIYGNYKMGLDELIFPDAKEVSEENKGDGFVVPESVVGNAAYAFFSDYEGEYPPLDRDNTIIREVDWQSRDVTIGYGDTDVLVERQSFQINDDHSIDAVYTASYLGGDDLEPAADYRVHMEPNPNFNKLDEYYTYCYTVKTIEEIQRYDRDSDSEFPSGAKEYNNHHYYIYKDVRTSWEDALDRCIERGGYLAVINDSKENEELYQYMLDMGYEEVFFGLTYNTANDEWYYLYGDTSTFLDWGVNSKGEQEPNKDGDGENYAQLDVNMSSGHWNDCKFGKQVYTPTGKAYKDIYTYICEWDY